MAAITYKLTNISDLTCFAAAEDGLGGWTDSRLPAGMDGVAGMYLILNQTTATPNRYVGIARDVGDRFKTRLASVCELGFSQEALASIYVFWGRVYTRSDDRLFFTEVLDYSAPCEHRVNNQMINLEKLLIRFFMEKFTHSRGHTMTNNMLIKSPYRNPTTDTSVRLEWKQTDGNTYWESHTWTAGSLW